MLYKFLYKEGTGFIEYIYYLENEKGVRVMLEIKSRELRNFHKEFDQFSDVIAIEAILKGYSKGKLYINDFKNPEALVIWNEFDGFYVSLSNEEIITGVYDILSQVVKDNASGLTGFVIYIDEKYDDQIAQIIPAGKYSKLEVLFYTAENFSKSRRCAGNNVIKEIKYFKDIKSYIGFENLIEVVESTWISYEAFKQHGEGFVAIDEEKKRIMGYCISEHVTNSSIEFSIELEESYQGKGVGFELGQKMQEVCKNTNKRPCWYCTDDNVASMRLAEKLGLELKTNFHVWYIEI